MKYKTLGVLAAALFLSGTGQTVVKGLIPPAFALNLKNKEQEVKRYIQVLQTERVPGERGQAAKLLGMLEDPIALDVLHKALISDTNTDVRRACANAIARINQKSSVPRLLEAIKLNRGRTDVQLAIIQALGDMGETTRDVVPVIVTFLRSPSPFVREATVEALWKITATIPADKLKEPRSYSEMAKQRDKVSRVLNSLLSTEKELNVLLTLTSLIADFRDPASVPILTKVSENKKAHVDVQSLARDALEKLEHMGVE